MRTSTADAADATPPYLRIAAEIQQRITSGELRAGDRVPSARQITKEWGVAIATATKVLAVLRQEGVVRAVPGVGTVVDTPQAAPAREHSRDAELTAELVVRAGTAIADAEGLAALSMRRVATELGVPTMSLYRHVGSKDRLVLLMADAAFGEAEFPDPAPAGWRERLELLARLQWAMYHRHPWVVAAIWVNQPDPTPKLLAHTEWAVRAFDDLGLGPDAVIYAHVSLYSYVRGIAVNLELEAGLRRAGAPVEPWDVREPEFEQFLAGGQFPTLARLNERNDFQFDIDRLFEFGLRHLLDGYAASVAPRD
ncbi:TetR/AcrR family transcriptional regulator C-terminal domain-containing protein [Nocardia suismassiliense]|uniref:TetR/AcrR family transcriptional regulator C-terminal domain-containing protein n=1 Tax=Nocardia suismassiliense TaxID=2077092 RepID=A0ABW6R337_9NOCA